ncbi:MAG: YceI family protein [Sphingobacteriaceae bacterium]
MAFTIRIQQTETYNADVQKSNIEWIGRKVLGKHYGNLKLTSGVIYTVENVPADGNFIINMKSITNTDLTDEGYREKLIKYLKSEDFFSIGKNPTASFQVIRISGVGAGKINVEGRLTIKGIANEVDFPATYQISGNTLTATASNVKLDRTKFNIRYGAKSFFDSLADKAIDNDFELNIKLVANK